MSVFYSARSWSLDSFLPLSNHTLSVSLLLYVLPSFSLSHFNLLPNFCHMFATFCFVSFGSGVFARFCFLLSLFFLYLFPCINIPYTPLFSLYLFIFSFFLFLAAYFSLLSLFFGIAPWTCEWTGNTLPGKTSLPWQTV
jgi:hypothetical protein